MIRVAQMIMARVLWLFRTEYKNDTVIKSYFDEQREPQSSIWDVQQEIEKEEAPKREIIKLFLDNYKDEDAPFSIQNFVERGFIKYKKMPGEWYGSNSAALVLEDLNTYFKPEKKLEVVVFNDIGIVESRCIERAKINWNCKHKAEEAEKVFEKCEVIGENKPRSKVSIII